MLGWRIKTGNDRAIPLLPEVVAVLRHVIGGRPSGPVFLRAKFACRGVSPLLLGDRRQLESVCDERQRAAGPGLSRAAMLRIAQTVWRECRRRQGRCHTQVVHPHYAFARPSRSDLSKSWRHTFATLLQDANVDPLIRQITLGHKPTLQGGLGMTTHYTHTRPETHRNRS